MKKIITSHKLAAIATVGMMTAGGDAAFAQATFTTMSKNIINATSGFTNLISTLCWVGGAGLGVAGIFKLKNHVDNPGQIPMKDGLVRLGAGGGLLGFPFIQSAMQGSISAGATDKLDASTLKIESTGDFVP